MEKQKNKFKKAFLWIFLLFIILVASDGIGTLSHEIYHFIQGEDIFCQKGIYIDRAFLGGGSLVYDEGCYNVENKKFWSETCEDKDGNRRIPHKIEERNAQIVGWSTRVIFSLLSILLISKLFKLNSELLEEEK